MSARKSERAPLTKLGMTEKEVWDLLDDAGIDPNAAYDRLRKEIPELPERTETMTVTDGNERGGLDRCPATPDGRLPPDEISACEFCSGTDYCAGVVNDMPAELEPRVCLRVTVDGDENESLCAEGYGDRQDDPAKVTCAKCRSLLPTLLAPPRDAGHNEGEPEMVDTTPPEEA